MANRFEQFVNTLKEDELKDLIKEAFERLATLKKPPKRDKEDLLSRVLDELVKSRKEAEAKPKVEDTEDKSDEIIKFLEAWKARQ